MDDDKLIRLEALRLAHEIQGAHDPRPIKEIVRDYEAYISTGTWASDKGLPAPAGAVPPATDAPVAKAKNVR